MGVNQFQAAEILNLTGGEVEITVGRDPQPGEDQVFQIIQQTNSTAEEEAQDSQDESPRKSVNESMQTDDGKKLFCFDLEKVNASVSTAHPEQKPEEDNVPQFTLDGVKKLSENPSIYDVNDLLDDEVEAEESGKVSDGEEEPKKADETEDDPREINLLKTSVNGLDQESIPPTSSEQEAPCCPYKNKYETLLGRLEKSDNLVRQLSSNLKAVKSQLLCRDQTSQLYVENVDQLINQVENLQHSTLVHTLIKIFLIHMTFVI